MGPWMVPTQGYAPGPPALQAGASTKLAWLARVEPSERFELPTNAFEAHYSIPLSYEGNLGRGRVIRTLDLLLPKQALHQAELYPDYLRYRMMRCLSTQGLAPVLGFEPRLAVLETVVLTIDTTPIFCRARPCVLTRLVSPMGGPVDLYRSARLEIQRLFISTPITAPVNPPMAAGISIQWLST